FPGQDGGRSRSGHPRGHLPRLPPPLLQPPHPGGAHPVRLGHLGGGHPVVAVGQHPLPPVHRVRLHRPPSPPSRHLPTHPPPTRYTRLKSALTRPKYPNPSSSFKQSAVSPLLATSSTVGN